MHNMILIHFLNITGVQRKLDMASEVSCSLVLYFDFSLLDYLLSLINSLFSQTLVLIIVPGSPEGWN